MDLEQAIQDHFQPIYRSALAMTGDPWEAEDLTQETFLVLSENPSRYQQKSRLYTWLYGVLLNLDRRRRRRLSLWRKKWRTLCERAWNGPDSRPAAEAPLEAAEWKDSLWFQVNQLPDPQRQTLVLRFSAELQYDEIAEILGCPLGTVKSRLHHGLAALRELLQNEGGEQWRQTPSHLDEDLVRAALNTPAS